MKPSTVQLAFERKGLMLPLEQVLPLKPVTGELRASVKYRQIAASIAEIGLIEPLMVYPQSGRGRNYILLDGLIRHDILRERGDREAFCLIATEDETYTYNHKVNRLSPMQQHMMIIKAIESGVSEERIAATLNVNVASIRQKRDMLKGICPEAVALLKDRRVPANTIRELRRVKPMRQIEMAELMNASNNHTRSYAQCLLAATPEEQLAEEERGKEVEGLSPDDVARMEREMDALSRDFRTIEDTHGKNVLNLVIAVGYLRKLLDSAAVVRYLSQHHREILAEFQQLVDSTSSAASEEGAAEG